MADRLERGPAKETASSAKSAENSTGTSGKRKSDMIELDKPTDDLLDDLFHAIDRPGSTDRSDALFQRARNEIERLRTKLERVDDAIYDAFAYRLGPDGWDDALEEYRKNMQDPTQ